MLAMRRRIVLLLALVASGCVLTEERSCTAVGCDDTVTVELGSPHLQWADELPLTLRSCIGESCAYWVLDAKGCNPMVAETPQYWCHIDFQQRVVLWISSPVRGAREVAVSVTLQSRDGNELFTGEKSGTLEPYYPNGYECDKHNPCWQATVDFSSALQ